MKKNILLFLIFSFLPALAHSLMLDDYSSTSTVVASTSADTGSSASLNGITGVNNNALEMTYSLGTGNWAVFSKDYSSRDFVSDLGNSIRVRYKATGSTNILEVKFTDSDSTDTSKCDKLVYKTALIDDNSWRTLNLPFPAFALFGDGTNSFDYKKVARVAVGVNQDTGPRTSGKVWIDKIEVLKSTTNLVDDFNDGADPNLFNQDSTAFATGGTVTKEYATVSGEKVMKITYNVPSNGNFSGITIGLGNRNYQNNTHLSFKIRGNAGGEVLKFKLESPQGTTELFVSTFLSAGITTSFQEVRVPLSSFTAVNFSTVTVFTMMAQNDTGINSGSGIVYLDDVAFIRVGEESKVLLTIDEMDMDFLSNNWDSSSHEDASQSVSVISDITVPDSAASNRVYQINYNFTNSPSKPTETPYTLIEKQFYHSIHPFSALKFQYKGTGSSNNVEFKLTDSDNTTWFKKFFIASNTSGVWKNAVVPYDQIVFFSAGDDSSLNLKKIKKVEFAVAKGAGGSGTFAVDSLEALESGGELDQSRPGNLITNIRTVNNPFSPNGDTVKDEVFFIYSLDAESKVNLRIYDLSGNEIKMVAAPTQSAGEHALSWDGKNSGNENALNGLYIFRLEAESSDNRKDIIRQIIGVLK